MSIDVSDAKVRASADFIRDVTIEDCGINELQTFGTKIKRADQPETIITSLEDLITFLDALSTDPLPESTVDPTSSNSPTKKLSEASSARDVFRRNGGDTLLIHVMSVWILNEDVQEIGCRAMAVIMKGSESAQKSMFLRGGLYCVIDCIQQWRESERVLRVALRALRYAAFDGDNRIAIVDAKVIELVMELCKQYDSRTRVLAASWSVLSNVSFGSIDVKERVARAGALAAMVNSIPGSSEDPEYLVEVYSGIRNLTFGSRGNQQLVYDLDCMPQLVEPLQKHCKHYDVLDSGLSAMCNVLLDHPGNVIAFSASGGVQWMLECLETMELAPSTDSDSAKSLNWSVAENGLFILANCARVCIVHDTQIARAMVEWHGVSVCNRYLNHLEAPVPVIQRALVLLSALTSFIEGKDQAVREKVVASLVGCVRRNSSNLALLKPCLASLTTVVSFDESAKELAIQSDAIMSLVYTMSTWKGNQPIVLQCTTVLDSLMEMMKMIDSNTEKMVIDEVVDVMSSFPDDARIQEHCCGILCKIGIWGNRRDNNFSDPKVIKMVENARDRHRGDYSVESLADQFLLLVMSDSNSRQGRSHAMGSGASSRLRSRSRTIGSTSNRSRSRTATKSRSPPRTRGRKGRGMAVLPGIAEEGEDSA